MLRREQVEKVVLRMHIQKRQERTLQEESGGRSRASELTGRGFGCCGERGKDMGEGKD